MLPDHPRVLDVTTAADLAAGVTVFLVLGPRTAEDAASLALGLMAPLAETVGLSPRSWRVTLTGK